MDRAPFPPLRAYSEENDQLEELASMLIDEYLEQYDHFQLQTYGLVEDDWVFLTQRGSIDVYKQRPLQRDDDHYGGGHDQVVLPRLMATGTIHASLNDIMFATVAPTSEAMHVKMAGMRSDDIDGLVLHTVTPVMASDPFKFCGVKWLLRRAPSGLTKFVRQRDFVFLEATGISTRPDGERIGFHLCHSIEFATTPQLKQRGIVRGKMAVCHFYRENPQGGKVDVWAMETCDLQGDMWTRMAVVECARAISSIRDLPVLAVTKKLMWFQEHRPPSLVPIAASCAGGAGGGAAAAGGGASCHRPSQAGARSFYELRRMKRKEMCYNCNSSSRWPWKKRRRCDLCTFPVCPRCFDQVVVFPPNLDPRTTKQVQRCCVTCILNLSEDNASVYASQCRLDPSQRGSAQATTLGEDTRPKYDKAPSKLTMKKTKKQPRRNRAFSGDTESTATTTTTNSAMSQYRQSVATCPEAYNNTHSVHPRGAMVLMEPEPEAFRRRTLVRVSLVDALARLQAVADATHTVQRGQGELYTSLYSHYRTRASTSPGDC